MKALVSQTEATKGNDAAQPAKTQIDAFTIRHLRQWCERYAPTSEAPDDVAERMEKYLNWLDDDHRAFLIDLGWTKVFDAMTEIEAAHAGQSEEEV